MNNELGKTRQSSVIMNYGPGSIIDFRIPGTGAAVSVVAAGLEQWEQQAREAGCSVSDLKRLTEKRLAEKLNVDYFRLPPIASDNPGEDDKNVIALIGKRFPGWLICPKCNALKPARKWGNVAGEPSRFCPKCSKDVHGREKIYVVPVRFIVSCRNGHLDDFPWYDWVHSGKKDCTNKKEFYLKADGPGLSGLILKCPKCRDKRSMENIFKKGAHPEKSCSGSRPWLSDADEQCNQTPMTLQRGASNLYFPQTESALVIPPWSEHIVKCIGHRWNDLVSTETKEARHKYIDIYLWDELDEKIKEIGIEEFKKVVDEKIEESKSVSSGNIRWDEYQQFKVAATKSSSLRDEFDVRVERVPSRISHVSNLQRVVSLREIRALKSFSRIEPPPGRPPVKMQYLSKYPKKWLPAVEVKGEGIFIGLDQKKLFEWEAKKNVQQHITKISGFSKSRVLNPDNVEMEIAPALSARYLLIHSLAHILMKQLSLQCGYSTASLRERIYVGLDPQAMSGVLIYTATSDSDGTLGGLQRQGDSERFCGLFLEAIRANEWCSSDPLCIKGLVSTTESSSIAACHSCLLAPETSCEDFNRFLDRTMLVGIPDDRSLGFFSDLLDRSEEH